MPPDHRPRTVACVRERHLALMKAWRGLDDNAARCRAVGDLRHEVAAAGAAIAMAGERDEAQGIIDYWASAVAGLPGESYPDIVMLAPYSGESARRAARSAREIYAALATEDEKRAARQLFKDLLVLNEAGLERSPPQTRAVLRQRIGGTALDTVLARFEETGAVIRLPGDTPASDQIEVSDHHLADDWPELQAWLGERRRYVEERTRIMAQAERWRAGGHRPWMLAQARDVDDLDQFRGETDLLDHFIRESKRTRIRFRLLRNAAIIMALVGLSAATIFYALQVRRLKGERLVAQTQTEKAIEDQTIARSAGAISESQENLSPSIPAVSGAGAPTERLPGMVGALWLGSAARPQVAPVRSGERATALEAAEKGTAYRVLADIYLRADVPDPFGAYASKPKKAIIPAGSMIVLLGKSQGYDRPTGRQFWAIVLVVPRIFIQFAGGTRETIDALRDSLSAQGFDMPAAERTTRAIGLSEMRYFTPVDRDAANAALAVLRRSDLPAARNAACRSFAESRLSSFTLELWIETTRRPPPSPGC